jgi:hypothetical protein
MLRYCKEIEENFCILGGKIKKNRLENLAGLQKEL